MIVATAGHVDHGKTSLVKALTGIDADRLPEEKRRGMTIDLGFAYLPGKDGQTVGFVDVPGHERFIHNMLAGVTGIDCALLVVAADDGPMPQTREHLAILDLLGVSSALVALTKIDAVDAERAGEAKLEIAALLASTVLAGAPVYPVSSLTGDGIAPLREDLARRAAGIRIGEQAGSFRMTVDRAFTLAGAGLVVTGTVLSGEVAVGDQVSAMLANVQARVRGLHAQNRAAAKARVGERCALNLAGQGIDAGSIARGDVIAGAGVAPPAQRIDVRLRILPSEARAFRHWTPVHAHIGAADVSGRVALLEADALAPGESGLAQLVLDRPVAACHGDAVILRDQSARRTIGGGPVVDVFAPARGRARPARLAYLRAMSIVDPALALASVLEVLPQGLELARFGACRNLDAARLHSLAQSVPMHAPAAGWGFGPAHWARVREAAVAAVAAWHARLPDSPGVPEDRLLDGRALKLARPLLSALAQELVAAGLLARAGATLALPGRKSDLSAADSALWNRLRAALEEAGARPPSVAELARVLVVEPRRVKDLLVRCGRRGVVMRVAEERFAMPATVNAWAAHAQALAGTDLRSRFTAAQFRDQSGLGRNLAIEVLEFFDRVKFTRRIGEARLVVAAPAALFGAGGTAG